MSKSQKITLYIAIIIGIIYGYKYFTGKNLTDLPREIDAKLHQKDTGSEKNARDYYNAPEKNIPK